MIPMRRPFRVALTVVAWLAVAITGLAATSREASAHAVLLSSTPRAGEQLAAAPREFRLIFSEPVAQARASLVDRDGRTSQLQPIVSGAKVVARLPGSLEDGAYALNWQVVSEDGHPVSAAIVFSVGRPGDAVSFENAAASGVHWPAALTWAAKFVFYASCLFGIGGVFFAYWIERRPAGSACLALLLVAGLSAGCSVGLLGVELTGVSLSEIFSVDVWIAAAESSLARSVAAIGIGLALGAVAIIWPSAGRACSLAALAVLGVAFALTGHASGAGVKWLSCAAVAAHVMAATFWAGALPRLRTVLRAGRLEGAAMLARFSSAVPVSIAVLLAAGLFLASIQLGSPDALLATRYGNVLAIKIALVGAALVLGTWNRLFLTKPVLQGHSSATRAMRRVVTVEIGLLVLALALTAVWRFTPPPRSLALQVPVSSSVHIHAATAMASVSFETTRDLSFDAEVFLQTAEFDELDAKEVRLRMSAADGSVSAVDVPLERVSPGLWRAEGFQAPCDCNWNLRVEALVSDFDLVTLTGPIRLLSGEERPDAR